MDRNEVGTEYNTVCDIRRKFRSLKRTIGLERTCEDKYKILCINMREIDAQTYLITLPLDKDITIIIS